jgi:hypothetical protein
MQTVQSRNGSFTCPSAPQLHLSILALPIISITQYCHILLRMWSDNSPPQGCCVSQQYFVDTSKSFHLVNAGQWTMASVTTTRELGKRLQRKTSRDTLHCFSINLHRREPFGRRFTPVSKHLPYKISYFPHPDRSLSHLLFQLVDNIQSSDFWCCYCFSPSSIEDSQLSAYPSSLTPTQSITHPHHWCHSMLRETVAASRREQNRVSPVIKPRFRDCNVSSSRPA